MGLCKCPRKKVTQHFCFEHKVNVCEFCMVNDHPKCVVGPYLKWLQDDSYQKLCSLCHQDLSADECVRLLCFHVFHWTCLNKYATDLPTNTAPAGYMCPDCQRGIFPPSSSGNTPVSFQLRKLLSQAEWARVGLGLPIVETNQNNSLFSESQLTQVNKNIPHVMVSSTLTSASQQSFSINSVKHLVNANAGLDGVARKSDDFDTKSVNKTFTAVDIDEDKYRRKSFTEFFLRWLGSRGAFLVRRLTAPKFSNRRWIILGVVLFITVCTFLHYFLKFGRLSADTDPLLDPNQNPLFNNREDFV